MDKLGMSLDDVIKSNPAAGKGRGRGAKSNGRGGKKGSRGAGNAPKPAAALLSLSAAIQKKAKASSNPTLSAKPTNLTTGTKLRVANLDRNVTSQDIEELFAAIGDIKSASVELNAAGASKCWAIVVYKRRVDAMKAITKYNGVPLDGRPLKITEMAKGDSASVAAQLRVSAAGGKRTVVVAGIGRGGSTRRVVVGGLGGKPKGGRGGGKGSGGRRKVDSKPVSMEDLDADLNTYKSAAA